MTPTCMGSPPRMRGKLLSSRPVAPRAVDHPRGCGENRTGALSLTRRIGSPPRMRGKRTAHPAPQGAGRITPADAGKTLKFFAALHRVWDHPRGCGENHFPSILPTSYPGSPPRMRGKLVVFFLSNAYTRITPADAGKTFTVFYMRILTQDHPRGCGENGCYKFALLCN